MSNYSAMKEAARPVYQMPWHYLGGWTYTCNGQVLAALPADCTAVIVGAEGGDVWYSVNGITANDDSPGFVAEDTVQTIGPFANMTALVLYGTAAATLAHVQYVREA